ncbi:glycoside hydrolase family 61 protein [Armillaria novae-zelandiae]|uniref:AA9 family lytic polysaccharide monooxygenase n=1 Tax=Armillaria novae-zelandiae TaxID=153914 RepID=A0AA39PR14_9AGAR|nr:glycoside hydrolase family 61 protein [Armillaria novae-zelandiae]
MRGLLCFSLITTTITSVVAHTRVYGVWINGVFQGDGRDVYIRSPPTNDPVKDITSSAMACNVNNIAVGTTLSVTGGDKFTFEWYHDSRDDDIIAASHLGPIAVYIAPTTSNGAGTVWTKVFEDVYNGTWATTRLISAHGQHTVVIPDVPAGDYLLRGKVPPFPCKAKAPPNTTIHSGNCCTSRSVLVVLAGTYTDSTPGILWNVYDQDPTEYVAPGPDVWSGSLGGSISQVGSA